MEFRMVVDKFLGYLDAIERSQETLRGYQMDLELFERFLRDTYGESPKVQAVRTEDIEDYLLYMKRAGLAPASRNRRLYTLRSFFRYCVKKQLCQENIAAKVDIVRLPFKERVYLSQQQVDLIAKAIDHSTIRFVVQYLYYSGLRIREALNLKLADVDQEEGLIYVRSGKGAKDRIVPMCATLRALVHEYLETKRSLTFSKSDYFFLTAKTGRLSPQYVNYWIHKAASKSGLTFKITAHSFRHSFASSLINRNVGIFHVQKLLGHADLRVTSRYCHTSIGELRQAVDQL